MPNRRGRLEVDRHDVGNAVFVSAYEKALFAKLPEVAAKHLTVFRTGRREIAVIDRDGALQYVLQPDRKLVVWTDAGPWTAETVDVSAGSAVEPALLRRLVQAKRTE